MALLPMVISPAARDDLRAIHQYGSRRRGEAGSGDYLATLKERLWLLIQQPEAGKVRPDPPHNIRGVPVSSHVIFYRLERQRLEIIRILHARQDVPRHL